jgi:hypothetical protein
VGAWFIFFVFEILQQNILKLTIALIEKRDFENIE